MKPVIRSQTGVGSTPWIKLSNKVSPFNVGFGCAVNGTVNYTVQHTFDDPDTTQTPTVFNHSNVAAATANQDGNYAFPVAAVRLTVNSGSGSVAMTLIEAGSLG